MSALNEDFLVQQTAADYLSDALGWNSGLAYNDETFGPGGTLGRKSDRDIVLTRYLRAALEKLNPGLPEAAYDDAVRQVADYGVTQSALATNRDKDALLRDGVLVSYRAGDGRLKKETPAGLSFRDAGKQSFPLRARAVGTRRSLPAPDGHRGLRQRRAAPVHGAEERQQKPPRCLRSKPE